MLTPNKRDLAAFRFIKSYIATKGYAPTIDQVGTALKMKSKGAITLTITRLQTFGWVERDEFVARSMRVVREPDASLVEELDEQDE